MKWYSFDMAHFRRTNNFRELGGYRSRDGRTVKHNLIYRSAAPAFMNEEELQTLEDMHFAIILDLRTSPEAEYRPDPLIRGTKQLRFSALPRNLKNSSHPEYIADLVRQGVILTEDPMEGLRDMYAKLPFNNRAYAELFRMLYDGAVPVLYHCSEGKDRTGIASILILLALGVSEEQALDDFMLTNDYMARPIANYMGRYEDVLHAAPELEDYFLAHPGVSVQNALVSLQLILQRYGSYERYFLEEYGMDERVLRRLRDMYLEH